MRFSGKSNVVGHNARVEVVGCISTLNLCTATRERFHPHKLSSKTICITHLTAGGRNGD
jgi:hypothetical protein